MMLTTVASFVVHCFTCFVVVLLFFNQRVSDSYATELFQ